MRRMNGSGALVLAATLWLGPAFAPTQSPVADAAERGDIETVRALLKQGADVNAAQGDGMTALHWAAHRGDAPMLGVLLYAGANVHATTRLGRYTPLHLASREGRSEAVRALLDAGAKLGAFSGTGATALHFAAEAGEPATVRALLAAGADVDIPDLYASRTPLMFATAGNRLPAIRVLLDAGADVGAATAVIDYTERSRVDNEARRQRARLMAAARPPDTTRREPARPAQQPAPARETRTAAPRDTARTARTAGHAAAQHEPDQPTVPDTTRVREPREPDSPTEPDTARTTGSEMRPLSYDDLVGRQGGMTALHFAAREGRIDAAKLLLDAGAAIDQRTTGDESTPLVVAVINGNYDLAMVFLERGADPNLASEDGVAPLFATLNTEWALRTWHPQPTAYQQQRTGYLELMNALLEAGAEPNARVKTHVWYAAYNAGRMGVDFAGATAFWRAAYATDVAAMKLLVKHGADPNIPTIKPAERRRGGDDDDEEAEDPSGLPPVPAGGPVVHPLHAASGVGYGTSRVGQQHRYVPDGWLPAVRYLVDDLGVDVNVRDHEGYSAVHNAAARGDNDVIRFLVERGADVTFVSRRGQTTVDMANGPQQRVQPFPETIALLESMGAKNNHKCLSC